MGRVAALGFAAALVGELLAGVGPATQLSYELGVTHRTVYLAAIALGVWGFVGGLLSGARAAVRCAAVWWLRVGGACPGGSPQAQFACMAPPAGPPAPQALPRTIPPTAGTWPSGCPSTPSRRCGAGAEDQLRAVGDALKAAHSEGAAELAPAPMRPRQSHAAGRRRRRCSPAGSWHAMRCWWGAWPWRVRSRPGPGAWLRGRGAAPARVVPTELRLQLAVPYPRAGFAGACVLEFLWNGESPLVHLGLIQPGTQLSEAPWVRGRRPGWCGQLLRMPSTRVPRRLAPTAPAPRSGSSASWPCLRLMAWACSAPSARTTTRRFELAARCAVQPHGPRSPALTIV